MTNIYTLFILLVFSSFAFAQSDSLRDYRWQIGYGNDPNYPDFGGTDFNFHETPVELTYNFRDLYFSLTNSSICDTTGNLLFYTNGIRICNSFGDTITNGNGLNPGLYAEINEQYGYKVPNGAFVLPDPGNESLYYLIHESIDICDICSTVTTFHFYFTIIDMSNPEGLVLSKNNLILQDTFDAGHSTAVRHANGRDWWIVKPRFDSNEYHTFLVDPTGISFRYTQEIGAAIDRNGGAAQAVFSPDGTKYARNDGSLIAGPQSVKLYDFDRCTGMLSNFQEVVIPDTSYGSGIAFSPNSRYLYSSVTAKVFQFDTEAPDLAASQQVVAEWDNYFAPYPFAANFFMMQLAPDNKIYVNCNNGVYAMHIIHEPDQPGAACDFEPMGLMLPTWNNSSLPHFPYYKLGALAGSSCDTLGLSVDVIEEVLPLAAISVYPNPTSHQLSINLENIGQSGFLKIHDALGKLIWSAQISATDSNYAIDVSPFANGIYVVSCETEEGIIFSEKFVKQ